MYFTVSLPALVWVVWAIWGVTSVAAHPGVGLHLHKHRRDGADWVKNFDWSNKNIYSGVNFQSLDYGQQAAPAPTPTPQKQNPSPAVPSKPAQHQEHAVQPQETQVKPKQKQDTPAKSSTQNTDVSSGGGKRGIAYNYDSLSVSAFNSYDQITWAFNWDSNPAPGAGNQLYVPLLFDDTPEHTSHWAANVKAATSGAGPHYLMAFNEPDQPAPQANMPVDRAVAAFRQYMSPYAKDNVFLGTPSVSNGVGNNAATGRPMGLGWLKPFLEQCSDCPIAFANVHWYGCDNGCPVANDVSLFKQQMQEAMDAAQLANGKKIPIWITEFQRLGGGQDEFLDQVLPWLDSQAQVAKYAYFMDREGILAQGGAVSALGHKYGA